MVHHPPNASHVRAAHLGSFSPWREARRGQPPNFAASPTGDFCVLASLCDVAEMTCSSLSSWVPRTMLRIVRSSSGDRSPRRWVTASMRSAQRRNLLGGVRMGMVWRVRWCCLRPHKSSRTQYSDTVLIVPRIQTGRYSGPCRRRFCHVLTGPRRGIPRHLYMYVVPPISHHYRTQTCRPFPGRASSSSALPGPSHIKGVVVNADMTYPSAPFKPLPYSLHILNQKNAWSSH